MVSFSDAGKGLESCVLKSHGDIVLSVAIHGDWSRVVSGTEHKTVRVWDVQMEVETGVFECHESMV